MRTRSSRSTQPGTPSSPASRSATTPSEPAPPPPPPPADTEAPSTPQNLVAAAAKGKKSLSWSTCTDNVGVTGYRVYRDGKLLATVQAPGYTDTLGGKSPTATYTVVAVDAAGNTSAPAEAPYADAATPEDEPPQNEPEQEESADEEPAQEEPASAATTRTGDVSAPSSPNRTPVLP